MNPLNRPSKAERQKNQTEERIRLKTILKGKKQSASTNRPVNHTTPASYAQVAAIPVIPLENTPAPVSSNQIQDPLDTFDQLKNPQVVEMFDILQAFIQVPTSNKSRSQKLKEIMTLKKKITMFNTTNRNRTSLSHKKVSHKKKRRRIPRLR
ncbi:hypothetical protein NPIL_591341 [Nephila pilipes]|uniref:Uncharacterized protein n=1 Tax=Nephila pilipes TaxID=299642 RepID=A0A8X6QPA2_NEPPI|nr:hypothetical protein NPIL_591341 [Nephila pilipes]